MAKVAFTPTQAAKAVGLSRQAIDLAITHRELTVHVHEHQILVAKPDLNAWVLSLPTLHDIVSDKEVKS